jgi:hypothetical protein
MKQKPRDYFHENAICEKNLWRSVLIQAIRDAVGCLPAVKEYRDKKWLQEDAIRWFRSKSEEPCSFLWLCDYLEINPRWIRAFIENPKFQFKNNKTPLPARMWAFRKLFGLNLTDTARLIGVHLNSLSIFENSSSISHRIDHPVISKKVEAFLQAGGCFDSNVD